MLIRRGNVPIPGFMSAQTGFRLFLCLGLLLFVAACASKAGLKEDAEIQPLSYAEAPATEGLLAELAGEIESEHGPEKSGFHVLDSSFDGLHWRLALIDSATTSLDIMTYLWYPDASGILLLERAILASQRGVKVRMVVDDLILHGHDQLIANLNAAPNIEFRMFNPWENRTSLATRGGEMLAQMERLNTRMHDKLMIADGHAAVIGGRKRLILWIALACLDNRLYQAGQFAVGDLALFEVLAAKHKVHGPLVVVALLLSGQAQLMANNAEGIATGKAVYQVSRLFLLQQVENVVANAGEIVLIHLVDSMPPERGCHRWSPHIVLAFIHGHECFTDKRQGNNLVGMTRRELRAVAKRIRQSLVSNDVVNGHGPTQSSGANDITLFAKLLQGSRKTIAGKFVVVPIDHIL